MNRYCCSSDGDGCAHRHAHSVSPDAAYALFNFDLSLKLPPETFLEICPRPPKEALVGDAICHPCDVNQGEAHYHPFAFDVACLEGGFVYYFTDVIPSAPSLALLFVRMTIHVVRDRFTAAEALPFFSEIEASLHPADLASGATLILNWEAIHSIPI
ncbi:hypothetical protein C8Q77DRAFT_1136729 [Trametes polyzona]|nr:hypothetical protein C8Q77DRAFT_1136729 [Trametes polyzona]